MTKLTLPRKPQVSLALSLKRQLLFLSELGAPAPNPPNHHFDDSLRLRKNAWLAFILAVQISFSFPFISGCRKPAEAPPVALPTPVETHADWIVYTAGGSLYLTDLEGNPARRLAGSGNGDWFPAVSPDHSQVAFWSNQSGTYELWVFDFATGHRRQLTRFADRTFPAKLQNFSVHNAPAWSPDGQRLAFAFSGRIWMIERDGFNLKTIVSEGYCYSPAWSPDGEELVYLSDRNRTRNLYLRRLGGKEEWPLTGFPATQQAGGPAWAPNGQLLAFTISTQDASDIWTIRKNGTSLMRLTRDRLSHSPTWSPDGKRLAFSSGRQDHYHWEIWAMNPDGTGAFAVTRNGGFSPSWFRQASSELPGSRPTVEAAAPAARLRSMTIRVTPQPTLLPVPPKVALAALKPTTKIVVQTPATPPVPTAVPTTARPVSAPVPAASHPVASSMAAVARLVSALLPAASHPVASSMPAAARPVSTPLPAASRPVASSMAAAARPVSTPLPAASRSVTSSMAASARPVSAPVPAVRMPSVVKTFLPPTTVPTTRPTARPTTRPTAIVTPTALAEKPPQEKEDYSQYEKYADQDQTVLPDLDITTDKGSNRIIFTPKISFYFAKDLIKSPSLPILKQLAFELQKYPDSPIMVRGEVTAPGLAKAILPLLKSLSRARANSVLRHLIVTEKIRQINVNALGEGDEWPELGEHDGKLPLLLIVVR